MKRMALFLGLVAAGCGRPIQGEGGTVGPQPLGSACTFDGSSPLAAQAVLVAQVGTEVQLVMGDGQARSVYRLADGAGVQPDAVNVFGVVARGGSIAASAEWSPNGTGQPDDVVAEVALLDGGGAVRFSRRWQGYLNQGAQLDPNGALTFADAAGSWVVTRDGAARQLAGWWLLGGPEAGGALPASTYGSDAPRAGWLDGAGRFTPLAVPFPGGVGQAAWNGARQVYLGDAGGATVVVAERPGDVLRATLPDGVLAPNLFIDGSQGRFTSLRWRGDAGADRMWRFDTTTGELDELSLAAPPGLRPFQFAAPQLDDQGALLQALRDDYRGAIYRSTDGGRSYSPLGLTVADVLALGANARSGTYVIAGSDDVYGGETMWAAAPPGETPDLDGRSLQLSRAGGPSYQLPVVGEQAVALSSDGGCAAWWQSDTYAPPALRALDVQSGARATVMTAPTGSRSAAWLE